MDSNPEVFGLLSHAEWRRVRDPLTSLTLLEVVMMQGELTGDELLKISLIDSLHRRCSLWPYTSII